MSVEYKLPDLGEGVKSADVASILVAEGETVSAGQNLLELETEKAVVELPASETARIVKILVQAGATVKPGDPIFLLEQASGAAATSGSAPAPATKPAPAPSSSTTTSSASPPATSSSGPREVLLPELGEGVKSADIANILVKVGDQVTEGQNLLELETEKAVVELPSPVSGRIEAIHVQLGGTHKTGDRIFTIVGQGTSGGSAAPAASAPAAAARPATATPPVQSAPPAASASAGAPAVKGSETRPPAPAGPATRRMARQLGVDLYQVSGTGPGGRITTDDLQAFVRGIMTGKRPSPSGSSPATFALPDFTQFGDIERKPMNKIARTAAANLSYAWQTIPHVTQHELADVTELEAGRRRASAVKGAAKITMTVLAIKAVVAALKQFPHFNSSLDPQTHEIIYKNYYHIGVAVDTEQGLVVPVIRDANLKSVLEIARELETLAGKARDRKLSPADFQGGTFTISNLGGIGGTSFTPIVNWPEVAILGMSRSREHLVIVDGEPRPRLMLPLSLSYDHRVINGADAARFIVKVAGLLADPSQLLIES